MASVGEHWLTSDDELLPDTDQIYGALAWPVERKAELPELGRRSADYVAKYHSADVIALRYVELYARLLEPTAAQLPT